MGVESGITQKRSDFQEKNPPTFPKTTCFFLPYLDPPEIHDGVGIDSLFFYPLGEIPKTCNISGRSRHSLTRVPPLVVNNFVGSWGPFFGKGTHRSPLRGVGET